MSDRNNVIPFRKRPPSDAEMQVYRHVTRSWPAQLRQLMLPDHFRQEQTRPKR